MAETPACGFAVIKSEQRPNRVERTTQNQPYSPPREWYLSAHFMTPSPKTQKTPRYYLATITLVSQTVDASFSPSRRPAIDGCQKNKLNRDQIHWTKIFLSNLSLLSKPTKFTNKEFSVAFFPSYQKLTFPLCRSVVQGQSPLST